MCVPVSSMTQSPPCDIFLREKRKERREKRKEKQEVMIKQDNIDNNNSKEHFGNAFKTHNLFVSNQNYCYYHHYCNCHGSNK